LHESGALLWGPHCIRAINESYLVIYLIRVVPNEMGMDKVLFLSYWVWVKKNSLTDQVRVIPYPLFIG
jgi:hypothetical protein